MTRGAPHEVDSDTDRRTRLVAPLLRSERRPPQPAGRAPRRAGRRRPLEHRGGGHAQSRLPRLARNRLPARVLDAGVPADPLRPLLRCAQAHAERPRLHGAAHGAHAVPRDVLLAEALQGSRLRDRVVRQVARGRQQARAGPEPVPHRLVRDPTAPRLRHVAGRHPRERRQVRRGRLLRLDPGRRRPGRRLAAIPRRPRATLS